jgi:hypothetical protein
MGRWIDSHNSPLPDIAGFEDDDATLKMMMLHLARFRTSCNLGILLARPTMI